MKMESGIEVNARNVVWMNDGSCVGECAMNAMEVEVSVVLIEVQVGIENRGVVESKVVVRGANSVSNANVNAIRSENDDVIVEDQVKSDGGGVIGEKFKSLGNGGGVVHNNKSFGDGGGVVHNSSSDV